MQLKYIKEHRIYWGEALMYIKLKRIFTYILVLSGILSLLFSPLESTNAAKDGILLCMNIIIPSLFPFLVFSNVAIHCGLANQLGKYFEFFMKPIFNVNGASSIAFILGILSGYPVGAKTAIELYHNNYCSKTEAERLLAFCNNSGPAFIISAIGVGIWGRMDVGIILYIAQIISSVIIGIIFGRLWKGKDKKINEKKTKPKSVGLITALVNSVKASTVNIAFICAFVVFFAVVIHLLFSFRIIPLTADFSSNTITFLDKKSFEQILAGFFEITTGIKYTALSLTPKNLSITAFILGWSGLSVHCQVLIFLNNSGLSKKPYFLGKICQAILSGIITYILVLFFPFHISTIHLAKDNLFINNSPDFTTYFVLSLCLLLLIVIIYLMALFISCRKRKNSL